MPHCIIEHSSSLNAGELNQVVFQGALESQLFEADGRDIKVRSIAYDHFQTGTQRQDFIHVTLRILSGRDDDAKLKLSQSVLSRLATLSLTDASLTVEVVDMERESYSKRIV